MNEDEMTGMAAPMDAPMDSEETLLEEPMEPEESKFDMETLMGNFMDLPQDRRQIATRLLASPAAVVFDEIVGEPVMQRLIVQLGETIDVSEVPTEEPSGMMAPTTEEPTAEEMPMEE